MRQRQWYKTVGDADDFPGCFIMPARIVRGTFQGWPAIILYAARYTIWCKHPHVAWTFQALCLTIYAHNAFQFSVCQKAFSCGIIRWTPSTGHGANKTCCIHSFQPDWPAIMPSLSLRTSGHSPASNVSTALSSIVLTSSASGRVLRDQLITFPSKKPTTGDNQTFPVGIRNSVVSVRHLCLGCSALKSLAMRLSGAGHISPQYKL